MTLEFLAACGTVISGVILPAGVVGMWMLRNLIKGEIAQTREIVETEVVPQLSNGHKSAATYAREARDLAGKAVEVALVADARSARVEQKLDAHVLASSE
jgi:hypothetical protein